MNTGSNNGKCIHSIVDLPSLHSLHSVAKLWHLQMLPGGGAIFFCNVHNTQASWSYEPCDNVLWSTSLPSWLNTYSARKHWIWPPKMAFFSTNVMWHTQQAIVVHEYKKEIFNQKNHLQLYQKSMLAHTICSLEIKGDVETTASVTH
jgi:hypothetical protein